MTTFAAYQDEYEHLWSGLVIRPTALADGRSKAGRIAQSKAAYQAVEGRTGVPWWFVGLCHYREGACNFDTYLGNGQPLGRITTIVPKGRGPFTGPDAFLNGAIDALRLEGFVGSTDWSIARVLYRLEGFNGYGYHAKQVNSPYLWGGSTAYGPPEAPAGKYVRDHVFDPSAVDRQLGTAVILKCLLDLDGTIALAPPKPVELDQPRDADEDMADDVLWLQRSLNRLGQNPPLAEDGRNGPRTMTAVSAFQHRNALDDTGLANARTIAAIQQALQPSRGTLSDAQIAARLEMLERQSAPVGPRPSPPPVPDAIDAPSDPAVALLKQVLAALRTPVPADGNAADPLRRLAQAAKTVLPPSLSTPPALGQVNGALGATIGNLLDGKKTAIGIIGAAATDILANVPATTGLGQVLSLVTPEFGLSPYTMPIFLALSAWGVLGKFEKWKQDTSPPAP